METAIVLKALADENRLQIIQLLLQHKHCVRALARKLSISEAAVSQHLKILREAGLVYGVKKGYYTHYCLDKATLKEVIGELERIYNAERKICEGKFYGCSEAEAVGCRSYVPPEKRGEN